MAFELDLVGSGKVEKRGWSLPEGREGRLANTGKKSVCHGSLLQTTERDFGGESRRRS